MPFEIWSRNKVSEAGYFGYTANWRNTEIEVDRNYCPDRLDIRIKDNDYGISIRGRAAFDLLALLRERFNLIRALPDKRCSFCGDDCYKGRKLIAGDKFAAVFICNECVEACVEILAEAQPSENQTEAMPE